MPRCSVTSSNRTGPAASSASAPSTPRRQPTNAAPQSTASSSRPAARGRAEESILRVLSRHEEGIVLSWPIYLLASTLSEGKRTNHLCRGSGVRRQTGCHLTPTLTSPRTPASAARTPDEDAAIKGAEGEEAVQQLQRHRVEDLDVRPRAWAGAGDDVGDAVAVEVARRHAHAAGEAGEGV